MSTANAAVDDITLDELEANPYPFYARLRQQQPVAYLPLLQSWWITTWEGCELVGRHEERLSPMVRHLHEFFGDNILTSEGEVHKWLRGGVDPPLRPRAVKGYIEERSRPVAREYVAAFAAAGGQGDASRDLLERISVRVIGDVLGMEDVDVDTLQRWFHALSGGLTDYAGRDGVMSAAEKAKIELEQYMRAAIDRVAAQPTESGLSHMVNSALGDGPKRTYEQLKGTIEVIILGGFQEPGHAAAASLLGLLTDPAQYQRAISDPAEVVPIAVHEGLRWIAPFGICERMATEDIEVDGVTIPAGAELALVVGSANHDEARYDHGERFDISRERKTHASFGYGAHFCSGHFISRQLEQIALEETLAGLPNLRLDPDRSARVEGFAVRGVKELPVVWDA